MVEGKGRRGSVHEQDEHLLARKFGDRWLYKALGSGLHGRAVHRREKSDPRKKLYRAVLLTNLQRGKAAPKVDNSPAYSLELSSLTTSLRL